MKSYKIFRNLQKIRKWVDSNSPPPDFDSNRKFMKFAVKIMKQCSYLLKAGASSVPDEETATKGYTKNRAIIVGHMVRITKLYEGMLMHIRNHQHELAFIFFSLIHKTVITMNYLITSESQEKTLQSFILASYRPEKEILLELNNSAKQEPLSRNKEVMRSSIISMLREDGISEKELLNYTIWSVDGKDYRDIMKEFEIDPIYSYAFEIASHQVHGDWLDIGGYHLKQDKEGHFHPNIFFLEPDTKTACLITHVCLDNLLIYLKWNKSDPENKLCPIVEKLHALNILLDAAFENFVVE